MAIEVGFFQNTNNCYSEGPFVIVNANGWRIEAGTDSMKCPSLPCTSIYRYMARNNVNAGKYEFKDEAIHICDWLNQEVKNNAIPLDDTGWPTFN